MAKVPGMPGRVAKHNRRREERFARKGIKGALNGLDQEAVLRERAGDPMSEEEFKMRAVEIVTRGKALLRYRLDTAAGRDTAPLDT